MANFFDQFDTEKAPPKTGNFFDQFDSKPSALAKAVEPITSYPSTQRQMAQESVDQVGRGVQQLTEPVSDWNTAFQNAAKGGGNIALGGLGYLFSPVNAGLRTIVGKPIEENTGIPKEIPELAASFALPIPKKLPTLPGRASRTAPTTEELFNSADNAYTAARASPFSMAPDQTVALQNTITNSLKDQGYRDFLTPKTFRAIGEFVTDAPSKVADIEAVRRALNIAAKDPAERDAARRAIQAIDEKLGASVPEIAQARGDYAAGMRSETIQEAAARADRATGSAYSGQNYDNAVRQQIKAIRNSPSKNRGFSADELAQMDDIISGSPVTNWARGLGNMLGGGGGLTAAVTGGMSKGLAPVFGYALKKLENGITGNKLNALDEMVRSRSPLGQSVGSSVRNWSEAAQEFEGTQSFRNFAKFSIASRNLSNNLKAANINIAPEDIMRTLQGPAKGAAEENQGPPGQ